MSLKPGSKRLLAFFPIIDKKTADKKFMLLVTRQQEQHTTNCKKTQKWQITKEESKKTDTEVFLAAQEVSPEICDVQGYHVMHGVRCTHSDLMLQALPEERVDFEVLSLLTQQQTEQHQSSSPAVRNTSCTRVQSLRTEYSLSLHLLTGTLVLVAWWCSGERRTRDQQVVSLTPGRAL